MGCALEIGWVNKERRIVSFTWLILLTSLFVLSLSHAPSLILYFSHAKLHPSTPITPHRVLHLQSLPLYLLSLPPLLPLSRHTIVSSVPPHTSSFFFRETTAAQHFLEVSVSCRLKSPVYAHVFFVLVPNCGMSRWIFLLVHIIAPAWYEMLHWLRHFKPQSAALFSWFCIIIKQTCKHAKKNRSSAGVSPRVLGIY